MRVLNGRRIEQLEARINEIDARLSAAPESDRGTIRPVKNPRANVIIALTSASEIGPAMFKPGCHLAGWVGLA